MLGRTARVPRPPARCGNIARPMTPAPPPPTDPSAAHDPRRAALAAWLREALGGAAFELTVASADASFRRYFRVHLAAGGTLIAMDAPPAHEDVRPWLEVARLIEEAGVHAPHVHAADLAQGFLLVADLGVRTYQDALAAGRDPTPLYRDALAALARLQGRVEPPHALPRYDRALLHREMELLREWLCLRHLGLELSTAEHGVLDRAFHWLEDQALAMPVAFVHRDWHARNLMDSAGEGLGPNPGVLDFQDAVVGPVAYDLVSLTRDAYLAWPRATIAGWIADFHHLARAERAPVPASVEELALQHDLIGVQRHLKVAGIFARLAERDGKRRYLDDIPKVLGDLLEVLPEHAPLRELDHLLRERIAPAFRERAAAEAGA